MTGHPAGYYRLEELKAFSNKLPAYTTYAYALLHLRSKARSVAAVTKAIRHTLRLRRSRLQAQLELQKVYDHVAFGLGLPKIPVRLPQRKRIRASGFVRHTFASPLEIRIFPLCGNPDKPRRLWKPADLGIYAPTHVCEILLHEIAHVHQGFRHMVWDHGCEFIASYRTIEQVFLGFGFGPLLPQKIRFGGCPVGSEAAKLEGTPREGV